MSEFDSSEIPLISLGFHTQQILSTLLNSRKILLSDEGHFRDWRGLANAAEISLNSIKNESNPTAALLDLWYKNKRQTATSRLLIKFLKIIDRYDVCDDIEKYLVQDVKNFQKKLLQNNNPVPINISSFCNDMEILTKDDVYQAEQGLSLQKYDAFLLYADEDINYANEMLDELENRSNISFKLCVKDRDLLGGVSFEHDAVTKLIEERCHRVVVILTSAFLNSPAGLFLVNYTQALQIQQRKRKIIPCLYEIEMDIPRTLKIYFLLKYIPCNGGTGTLYNFWDKLRLSIRNVPNQIEETPSSATGTIACSFQDNMTNQTTKRTLMSSPSISAMNDGLQEPNSTIRSTKLRCRKSNKLFKSSSNTNENIHNNLDSIDKTSKSELTGSIPKKGKRWLKTWRKKINIFD